tara:strand:+ start:451 stop:693 length:243 start_codon:yes stop_codon:yes gene_type:complete
VLTNTKPKGITKGQNMTTTTNNIFTQALNKITDAENGITEKGSGKIGCHCTVCGKGIDVNEVFIISVKKTTSETICMECD